MSSPLRLISSMATRHLLLALVQAWQQQGGQVADIESVGGVDAARRVLDGEAFDLVVLAADAMLKLEAAGRLPRGSVQPLADSTVAIAIRAGSPRPDVSTESALRDAVLNACAIGYSTGPSGTALMRLFDRWGIAGAIQDRLVQARPGVPVGSLVASGEVALGFQQFSELMDLPGITLLGGMPSGTEIVSRFSGAIAANAAQPDAAQALLDFMASPLLDDIKRQHGMVPVR